MNPNPFSNILGIIFGGIVRYGLVVVATWLTAHNILTGDEAGQVSAPIVVAFVAAGAIAFLFGLYKRFVAKYLENIAVQAGKPVTHDELKSALDHASFGEVLSTKPPLTHVLLHRMKHHGDQ